MIKNLIGDIKTNRKWHITIAVMYAAIMMIGGYRLSFFNYWFGYGYYIITLAAGMILAYKIINNK